VDRMHTYEYVAQEIDKSQNMSKEDKETYLKNYKKNYYLWLDELKQKLNNYKPLFEDLETKKSVSPAFNYAEYNLKGEVWKSFPLDSKYTVSNLGRIKFNGIIQKQKDDKIQYVTLADADLCKDYVYKLVAITFLGKIENDGYHIHHITNDGYYNTTDNLILLTPQEHSYVHGFNIKR